jgi:hypothetical protein
MPLVGPRAAHEPEATDNRRARDRLAGLLGLTRVRLFFGVIPIAVSTTLGTRPPGPIAAELGDLTDVLARCQYPVVGASADADSDYDSDSDSDSDEWIAAGAPTAVHYLAGLADIETGTAGEWIRIGRRVRDLPATADAFAPRRPPRTQLT